MVRQASEIGVGTQPQVFVSYARQDAEQVLGITRLLEQEGTTVWRDGDQILGGQYYGEQIVHAIAHSRVVLLMCSPQAFQSDNVHREVLLTWDHYHRRYIPVWLCPAMDIPERFRYCLVGCQWIDANSQPPERWLPQLLKALKALGVETKDAAAQPGESTPGPVAKTDRRGVRFRPGDKPIRGADWELERLLGKGGFGEVWKARNPHLPSLPPVALKFCLELDARSKDLLRHEADMVLRAQQQIRSDGIVPLLHAYLSNDPPCLEYPYIEGGTMVRLLDECRQSSGSFTPAQVQRIIHRIAQIVGPAHRAVPKLVHRDLKPSNVLVERRAEGKLVLRVTDFGIGGIAAQPVLDRSRSSSSMRENMASVLTGSYSPLYASPQQIRGDRPDPRDDVYALGVIWYQFLMGDLASPAPTGRRWIEVLRGRGMSDPAVDLLSSCFESDPAYRPADAGMLAEQLQALPASTSAKAAAPTAQFPAIELGPAPAPGSCAPPPRAEPKPVPPPVSKPAPPPLTTDTKAAPPARPVLNVTQEKVDRDAPSPLSASPDRRAGATPIPTQPQPQQRPTGTLEPSTSALETHMKPAPPARTAGRADATPTPSRPQPIVGRLKIPTRWLAAGLLVLFGFFGIVLYVVTDHGTGTPKPEFLTTRAGQVKLKYIPAGTFLMGSPDGEGDSDEHPQHEVRISRSFYLGVYEVTQAQYQAVMGQNRSDFSITAKGKDGVVLQSTDQHPAVTVSWLDAVRFCNALSEKEGLKPFYEIDGETVRVSDWDGTGHRLPSEAEWEYACRAKSTTRYSFGDDEGEMGEYAWYAGNSTINGTSCTHPVGQKRPNSFGLFDMHGNVWEWCWDGYGSDYHNIATQIDPRGFDTSVNRVGRGGGAYDLPANLRSANRLSWTPGSRSGLSGFRLARTYN